MEKQVGLWFKLARCPFQVFIEFLREMLLKWDRAIKNSWTFLSCLRAEIIILTRMDKANQQSHSHFHYWSFFDVCSLLNTKIFIQLKISSVSPSLMMLLETNMIVVRAFERCCVSLSHITF